MPVYSDRELAIRYGLGLGLMEKAGEDSPAKDWSDTLRALPSEDQIKVAVLLDEMSPVPLGISKEARSVLKFFGRLGRGASEFLGLTPGAAGRVAEEAAVPEGLALRRSVRSIPKPQEPSLPGWSSRYETSIPVEPAPTAEPFVVQGPVGSAAGEIQVPTGTLPPAGAPTAAAAPKPLGPALSWVGDTGRKAWDAFGKLKPLQKALMIGGPAYSAYQMAQGELPVGTGLAGMALPFIGLGRGWSMWKSLPIEMGAFMAGPRIENALYGWRPRAEQLADQFQQGMNVGGQQGMSAGFQQGAMAGAQQAMSQIPQTPQYIPVPMQQPMPAAPAPSQPLAGDYWGSLVSNPSVLARGGPAGLGQSWG